MKPAPHNVKRKTACTNYSQCLYQAAKEDWISFSCEDCPLFTGGEQENLKGKGEAAMSENQNSDAVKLCACGKKTISPRSDLCASCMAKRSAEKRKTNNALKEIKRGKDTIIDSPGSEGAIRKGTVLIIDFGEHASILEGIERQAEDDMRPLDMQILYVLKKHLGGCL